jgi:hypothetical protein
VPSAPSAETGADGAAGTSAAAAAAAAGKPAPPQAGAVVADESGVRLVTEVTDDQPIESFAALLKHGQADKAFSGMQVGSSDVPIRSMCVVQHCKTAHDGRMQVQMRVQIGVVPRAMYNLLQTVSLLTCSHTPPEHRRTMHALIAL